MLVFFEEEYRELVTYLIVQVASIIGAVHCYIYNLYAYVGVFTLLTIVVMVRKKKLLNQVKRDSTRGRFQ